MSRLEFNASEAFEAIQRSGFYHVSRECDLHALEEFAEGVALKIQSDKSEFTYTLVPKGIRSGGRSVEEWERIRKDAEDKRRKYSASKKRRQA